MRRAAGIFLLVAATVLGIWYFMSGGGKTEQQQRHEIAENQIKMSGQTQPPPPATQAPPTTQKPGNVDGNSWLKPWTWSLPGIKGPKISVSPSTINFGAVETNRSKDAAFVVKNVGSGALEVSDIRTAGEEAVNYIIAPKSFKIQPGSEQTVFVSFKPRSAKSMPVTLFIDNNAGSPELVGVSGMGAYPNIAGGSIVQEPPTVESPTPRETSPAPGTIEKAPEKHGGEEAALEREAPPAASGPSQILPPAPTAPRPTWRCTIQVAEKELFSIQSIGGGQRYVLRLTAREDRHVFRYDADWASAAAAAVFSGDLIICTSDTFSVIDRHSSPLPIERPVFLKTLEAPMRYHPSSLEGRGAIVTFVGDWPLDTSQPDIAEEVRMRVRVVNEEGFSKFLENVQAAGAWIQLEAVKIQPTLTGDKFARMMAKGWGTAQPDFPRAIKDDMGRWIIDTIWPDGISVISLRRYAFTGFPRKPAEGTVSPDGITHPGDVAPLLRALKHRRQPVYEAIAIDQRLAQKEADRKSAASRAAASKKAKQKAAAAARIKAAQRVIEQETQEALPYENDPILQRLRAAKNALDPKSHHVQRANEKIEARIKELQAGEEQKTAQEKTVAHENEIRDAVSSLKLLMTKKTRLDAYEVRQLRSALSIIKGTSQDEIIPGWPTRQELRRAEELIKRAEK